MRRRGFTLIELLVVMTIIGILMSLILKAYMGGVRRAEEKATVALVAKLEQAMTDRVDGLTTYRADPSLAHQKLAALYNALSLNPDGSIKPIPSVQRAQAIAQFDYIRAQLPDIFAVQANANYPLNFAGTQFGPATAPVEYAFQLPIGNSVPILNGGSWDGSTANFSPGTGIFGASYEIAAGVYKQLGYGPKGYDGADNDGNGLVDERAEGNLGLSAVEIAAIDTRLGKHTHKTARSEMLYAILVEGGGAYGSAFDKDDFTSKEVQDTDGDGLLEFVDAWGEPLQYYRWPILYRSDAQKGYPDTVKLTEDKNLGTTVKPGPYPAVLPGTFAVSYESREQNPLDPNQNLVAPAWWGAGFNTGTLPAAYLAKSTTISGQALTFMQHFGPCLVDPAALNAGAASQTFWDRSGTTTTGYYQRRAYYSRFLILSAGPDKIPGTAQLFVDYKGIDDRSSIEIPGGTIGARDGSGGAVPNFGVVTVAQLLLESQGGKVDLNRAGTLGQLSIYGTNGRNDTNSQLEYYSQDDITSQNLQGVGGVLQ